MKAEEVKRLYQEFGKKVWQHRKRLPDMTQEKLGHLVGLSRTSITNIEKGRQHVSLHHLLSLAAALNVSPHVLIPEPRGGTTSSWVTEKIPEGIEKEIAEWAGKIVGE